MVFSALYLSWYAASRTRARTSARGSLLASGTDCGAVASSKRDAAPLRLLVPRDVSNCASHRPLSNWTPLTPRSIARIKRIWPAFSGSRAPCGCMACLGSASIVPASAVSVPCALAQGADPEIDRRLDQHSAVIAGVKRVGREYRVERDLDVVARIAKALRDAPNRRLVGVRRDELAPQLAGDELGGRGLGQQDVEHLIAIELARSAEHRLLAVVMDEAAKNELPGLAIEAPAGEGACGLLDVLLCVVSFAKGKKLHHFAREILVRRALAVLRVVEIDDHRRVARDGVQQVRETAERIGAQRSVLSVHQLREFDFLLAGDEMVVPEKRHPLD